MAITIKFDSAQLPEKPTFVLATRSGIKLGELFTAQDAVVHDNLTSASEISLTIYKELDGVTLPIWDDITALKLIWVKEWDKWFEIDLDTEQTTETVKHITGTSLSEAELSQLYLYNIEINTEDDILNDDYTVTVLYDSTNPKGSLLDRLLSDKAPHYTITHVDSTIASIQRSFSFDGTTILDAFYEIAEEIGCIFIFDSGSNADGSIARTIKVYDLETACMNDNCDYYQSYSNRYRIDSMSVCPKCGSTNLHAGYGSDTTIFVSSDNLSDDVTRTPDTDSVKNCLKMVAGDDLMTSVIMSCNPAGTQYMWSIPQWMRSDMSQSLQDALQAYDELYDEYKYTKEFELTESVVEAYNALVADYQSYDSELFEIDSHIVGFSGLTEILYDLIDFENYLQTSLMPDVSVVESTVEEQVSLIRDMVAEFSNTISLATISSGTSQATVESTLKLLVRAAMDTTRYSYEITTSAFSNTYKSDGTGSISWSGYVTVTSETENDDGDYDSAVTSTFTVAVNNDYQNYIEQLIYKTVSSDDTEDLTVSGLFAKALDDFTTALKQYALDNLEIIADCCQGVLDVLLEYGAGESTSDYYTDLYYPYYQKLQAIETEMDTRSAEIAVIESVEDEVDTIRTEVSDALDFEGSLGEELWAELCAYRREDTYENSNYISDGLSNSELVSYALQFVERTEEELQKASTLQHTISTTLRNLLVIPEFSALVDYFSVGNWIRVEIDGEIYRLRLESYEIDYNDLTTIQVEFSDVEYAGSTNSDLGSLFSSMSAVASSYPYTAKQVSKNSELTGYVSNWVDDGLDITNTNLVNNNDNQYQVWDEHGFLLKKYNAILDDYEDTQMKLVNRGLYLTNDNWETVKTAVGLYWYNDPTTGELTSTYGIMAETLVGKLILGESLGIYNSGGGLSFDTDGLTITNGINTFTLNPNSEQLLTLLGGTEEIFYVDDSGNLMISGNIAGGSINLGNGTFTVDSSGNLTSTSGLIGNWHITHYNLYSQFSTQSVTYEQVAMTDEDGNYICTTEYVYDEDGNLVPETDEDGNVVYTTEYVYDEDGNPVYETDADGNIVYETWYVYDDNGDIVYEYEYDDDGNVVYDDDGNPTYATDDDGNYIPQTQEAAVQQTQQVISYQTQEVISYETVEVTQDSYYDNYTSLNTSGTNSDIAISVGADEVDEDGIPVSSTGLIRLYNSGKLLTKSLYIEYDDADAEPAIFFRRHRSGATTQAKIHSGNNDDPFIAFGFWKDINTDTSGTYSVAIKSGGIAPYANGTYYCGNSSKRWSQVYTKELNVSSSCVLPCVIRMYDSDGHLRTVSKLYDDGGSNYGSNLLITGNGNTIIGGGEAPYNLYNAVYYGSDSEHLVLCSDGLIRFYVNCQTISNRKCAILNASLQFYPSTTNTGYLGTSSYRWGYLYAKNVYRVSESSLSDRKAKQNITELTEDYQDFIMGLQPVSFDFIEGDSHRKHLGFIAQDVRDTAMKTVGDLALFKASVVGHDDLSYNSKIPDEKLNWSLSYSEIIAPLVLLVQSQQKQIKEMQAQLAQLV